MLELLAYLALDVANLVFLSTVYDADAGSLFAGTSCAPGAVGVVLDIVGQAIVDDVCEVVHVQSARCNVCCHE